MMRCPEEDPPTLTERDVQRRRTEEREIQLYKGKDYPTVYTAYAPGLTKLFVLSIVQDAED